MPETYVCKKCGAELDLDDIENWSERACPECDEPIPWDDDYGPETGGDE